jgi:hypothetical protein
MLARWITVRPKPDVRQYALPVKSLGDREADADRRVEVTARDMTEGECANKHCQTEGQPYPE